MAGEMGQDLKNSRIMIVDDEPIIIDIIETYLADDGYHNVITVTDSKQALKMIEDSTPDLLILDLMMPDVSGFDILAAVRAHPVLFSLNIMILSAANDHEVRFRALELGINDFLTKPFNAQEFGLRVRNVLAARAYERQLNKEKESLEELVRKRSMELAQKEAALEKKMAEMERFTYTISHDMKTPLVTILGFIGQLQEDLRNGDNEQVEIDLDYIRSAGNCMSNLLQSLLHLAKSGRIISEPQRVDLSDVARDAVKMTSLQCSESNIRVTLQDALGTSPGDPVRLLEVFQNLIENSIKFAARETKPRIEIGSLKEGGRIFCYVRDNGVGISPEYHEKIFGLFDKLDPSTDGVGVGLTIVRRIIEEHGGKVWVESKGKGTGATFWFTLTDYELMHKAPPVFSMQKHNTLKQTENTS